jgi:dihydrofolate reductase
VKRKIILNLAISVDGYIADQDGRFDWIKGDGHDTLDTANTWDYAKFLAGVDLVVMGKKCYDQGLIEEFRDKQVIVATSQKLRDVDNIRFMGNDICGLIEQERQKPGQDIYLFGGGVLVDAFLKSDIIDEFIIGVIPIILGRGRPLFLGDNPTIRLKLEEYIVESGVVILRYSRSASLE